MNTPEDNVNVAHEARELLTVLGVPNADIAAGEIVTVSPISGEALGHVAETTPTQVRAVIERAHEAYLSWRDVPAPRRGELVRLFGEELREHQAALGRLISIEVGKIKSEGRGEVQEMIDICDFAVGLSRQLYGLTIATERAAHRMMECWHPLGVIGIISAFNFPAAVWSWNAALSLVCGNSIVWKPSEKAPLTALATQSLFARAMSRFARAGTAAPQGLSGLIIGGPGIGEILVDDPRVALVSATGSTAMGRTVGPRAARRFGRSLLELGGNNAALVCPSADLDLAIRAIVFSAMGTAGQRCTTLRRLFVHEGIYEQLVGRLKRAYTAVKVGNPLVDDTLIGPLIDGGAFAGMQKALREAKLLGGCITGGERVIVGGSQNAYYVRPALVEIQEQRGPVEHETFAPILYVMRYADLRLALELHNGVRQGLSSAIFTADLREAEVFMSASGSDCGVVNVNIGTSGAEIGGAFGGEKETGGGREAGSDSWKNYMRRATTTINYGNAMPLAQGVEFDVA
jgi:aldehyde dehydrogenase (NAD+)